MYQFWERRRKMKHLLLAVLLCGGIAWGQTETKVLCYGSADSDELFWIEAGDTCHADRKFRTAWSANLKIAGRDNELDTLRVELAALRREVEELKKRVKELEPKVQLTTDVNGGQLIQAQWTPLTPHR
jgi:hypothetical protein